MTDHIHRRGELTGRPTGIAGRLLGPLTRGAKRAHESMFGLARHADWYDSVPGRLAQPLYRRVSADVAGAGLPDGAFVLDVGTGPGRVPLLVSERCPSLVVEGVDLSDRMIARAVQAATGAKRGRLTYRVADVTSLPYADRSVDLVVSSLSLHHWTDVPGGLAEIQRVLSPGGRAWIYDVRPVLRRVAAGAPARDLPVALEALEREPGDGLPGRMTARVISRLTVIGHD